MKKIVSNTSRLFLMALFLTSSFTNRSYSQTTIYSTDFGTAANSNPTGWTFTGVDMNVSTNSTSSGYAGASGNAYLGEGNSVAFTNTFGTAEPSSQVGTSTATLLTSTIGYNNITIGFGMRKSSANYNSNATYVFEWSTDGTNYTAINYTEATAGSWGLATGSGLTLPAATNNQTNLYLRWTFNRTGTSSNFKIDDFSVLGNSMSGNTPPTIVMDVVSTTNYIDGGASVSPASPYSVSGGSNDPTDPSKVFGIDFIVNDVETPQANLIVTAYSNNQTVVPNSNIILTGTAGSRNVKITPINIGYSNITVKVFDGTDSTKYVIVFASSDVSPILVPNKTFWHTGMSDGSDAVAIDDNYYMCADDELDVVNVYARYQSGLPLFSINVDPFVNSPDPANPELDTEAGAKSFKNVNKAYWLGSMSNGKAPSFNAKPNRDRIFATTNSGTGAATTLSFGGYCAIKNALVAWGDANGYNFSASSAAGVDSKSNSGFAAEGMVFAPDSTTLWIGLRAPLVPTSFRHLAVIAPVLNFETWFNNGNQIGNPVFGAPIELDLGFNGIRDMTRLSNGTYIIVGGCPCDNGGTSDIFKWTGNPADAPIQLTSLGDGVLNMEGVMGVNVAGNLAMDRLQIISDQGAYVYYGDGTAAKDFLDLNKRKFRSDVLTSLDLCMITKGDTTATACDNFSWYGTTYSASGTPTHILTTALGCDSTVTLNLTINSSPAVPTITQAGSLLTSSLATTYQWFFNGTIIPGATSQNYTATQNGNFTVTVTNATGCSASSLPLTVNPVGINNAIGSNNSISIYPNPATTSITFNMKGLTISRLEIYNTLGSIVLSVNTSTDILSISTEQLQDGLYFVKFYDAKQNNKGLSKFYIAK